MPISLMTLRLLRFGSIITLGCLPAFLAAQVDTTGKEEERLEQLARSQGEWATPLRSKLSVGFRMLTSGGRVDFQNLGVVSSGLVISPASDGPVTRNYLNGNVRVDSPRASEKDSAGNVISTPGGRYDVYSTVTISIYDEAGNVTGSQDVSQRVGDLVSYTPGLTREWTAKSEAQLAQPGYVSFSDYNATSGGGSATHKQGPTGGVEFQFSRDFGRGSRYVHWGMVAGITLNDINSKSAGTVSSTLHVRTDFYSTGGKVVAPERLDNPNFTTFFDSNGDPIANTSYETTTAISGVPESTTNDVIANGVNVDGRWQVKGSYFMFRFGPSMRTQITDRLGLVASVGLAGAYAGTRYTAFETFAVPNLTDATVEANETSTTAKFLSGYFADLNVEWAANEVLGLFGGVTAQQLSDYEQKLGDRTARIDLGTSVGLRGGISIKF
ncbi:MAG TPA: hypothetical protein VG734_12490 [Lacunisphaera sp.]|nr:hypothetical protein [Lacunisphaera sp.]